MEGFCRTKPDIDYPCLWLFKVIGGKREAVAAAIAEVMGEAEHIVSAAHASSGGKYHSFNLELMVESETHRDDLYQALAACPVVKVVL
ncbi:MAG: DUF493 domain-containing protein [Desulfobulbaceae bacterium]|nr:DUF493 domain-containing protein [Desulfobulbaceae bacterium]